MKYREERDGNMTMTTEKKETSEKNEAFSFLQDYASELISLEDAEQMTDINRTGIRELVTCGYIPILNLDRVRIRKITVIDFLSEAEGWNYEIPEQRTPYYPVKIKYDKKRNKGMMYNGKLLITAAEAGEILGITDKKVREYVYQGILPATYLSGMRFLPASVFEFAEKTKGLDRSRTVAITKILEEREKAEKNGKKKRTKGK